MLRLIFTALFLLLFLLVSIIIQLFELILGCFNKGARDRSSLAIVKWAFRVIIFISGCKVDYIGLENVPADEPVLYVMNHRGFFDIILTYIKVPRPTGYIAKKEIEKTLMLAWWMKLLHCQFMDRKDIRKGLECIKKCCEEIKQGYSMVIYPEGTRNKTAEPVLDFHMGSFKIAEKTNCKIVPVSVCNTENIFENYHHLIRKQHVIIEYLPAIDVAAMSREEKKELADITHDQIRDAYLKNVARIDTN